MKVFEFIYYENQWEHGQYKCNQSGDNSGEYVSLAEYQALKEALERSYERCGQAMSELEALLKRWNEIAPGASWVIDNADNSDLSDEIDKLIQDTRETLS